MEPRASGKLVKNAEAHIAIDRDIEAHQAVEQQILVQKTEIISPELERNAFTPISLLSNELLCVIFSLVKAAEEVPDVREAGAPEWINVTHVCRHWRNVALNYPSLWAVIVPDLSLGWLRAMLERSQTADLSINFDYDGWHRKVGQRKLKESFRHSKRIVHLWLLDMGSDMQTILNALPTLAPRLETLRLVGPISAVRQHLRMKEEFPPFVPPGTLLDGRNLRQLELSWCSIGWDSHLIEHLIHLKLNDIAPSARPTTAQLFEVLGKLTNLECLELENALPICHNDGKAYFSSRMHFNYLTKLVVSSKVTEVQAFFHSITFPTSTTVDISANHTTHSALNYTGLLSDVTGSYASSVFELNFQTLVVDHPSSTSFRLQLYLDPVNSEYDTSVMVKIPHWRFRVELDGMDDILLPHDDRLLTDFWSSEIFCLREVTHVHLNQAGITVDVLKSTVGSLPEVCFIRLVALAGGTGSAIMDLLSDTINSADNLEMPLIFPKLATIDFERVRFNSTKASSTAAYDIDFGLLRNCLAQRAAHGASVEKLKICLCIGVQEADILLLRENIETVYWDKVDWEAFTEMFGREFDAYEDTEEDDEEDEEYWEDDYDDPEFSDDEYD